MGVVTDSTPGGSLTAVELHAISRRIIRPSRRPIPDEHGIANGFASYSLPALHA